MDGEGRYSIEPECFGVRYIERWGESEGKGGLLFGLAGRAAAADLRASFGTDRCFLGGGFDVFQGDGFERGSKLIALLFAEVDAVENEPAN